MRHRAARQRHSGELLRNGGDKQCGGTREEMILINLQEAIKHCLDVAGDKSKCKECRKDHRQLAEWLSMLDAIQLLTDGMSRDDTVTVGELRDVMWGGEQE